MYRIKYDVRNWKNNAIIAEEWENVVIMSKVKKINVDVKKSKWIQSANI